MNKLGLVFAGALALAMAFSPVEAFARQGGPGGHGGGMGRPARSRSRSKMK